MKRYLGLMILAFMVHQAHGAISVDKKYKLNQMNQVANEVQLGTLVDEGGQSSLSKDGISPLKVLQATYDYSVQGGASSFDIELGVSLPDNAVIMYSFLDILTQPVGPGATVAVKTEASGDVLAATSVASLAAGRQAGVSDYTAANMKKMTAARGVKVNIANTSLTAGKFKVYLHYVVSE